MRIAWATDIHLDSVHDGVAESFCRRLRESACEHVLLGGDIANAPELVEWLSLLQTHIARPICFVLGNHDYYAGSIAAAEMAAREAQGGLLRWLDDAGVVQLTPATALVGTGGWGDARLGAFLSSPVAFNDYFVIQDLRRAGSEAPDVDILDAAWFHRKEALLATLRALGTEAAARLAPPLEAALADHERVVVLTHVPAFAEGCLREGRVANDDWLPVLACGALGEILVAAADRHPEREILVLSGHTHREAEAQIRPNLRIRTGEARYMAPDFQLLDVP